MTDYLFTDLCALSGLKQAKAVRRWLESQGIAYHLDAEGKPWTTREAVNGFPRGTATYARPKDSTRSRRMQRARERICVLPIDQLRGLPNVGDRADAGVYFLWSGPELAYVGQSVQVATRVHQHKRNKKFTRATWMPIAQEALRWCERDYVGHYHPPQNQTNHG